MKELNRVGDPSFTKSHSYLMKDEYLVVIDRSGDVIVRKMELSIAEAKLIESKQNIYSVIRMDKLNSLKLLTIDDLSDEEQ